MTDEDELLRRGQEMEAAGDLEGAEAAYRQADESGSALGALLLGLLFKRRDDLAAAAEAFLRSETRGHPEAGSSLGNLLADSRDFDGARSAYERSIAAGSTAAVLNLGLMLADTGAADEALHYLRMAERNGDAGASWAIGRVLEDRGDFNGAIDAYRKGADAGIRQAAFGLGVVLARLEDFEGARTALSRARDLGDPRASQALELLDAQLAASTAADTGDDLVEKYTTACQDVLVSVNSCLEVANRAVGARNTAQQRPQHPISIETFTRQAHIAEAEFRRRYRAFGRACALARDTAARLLASQPEPMFAEMLLVSRVPDEVLGNVATAKSILAASFGPSPAAFIQGIREANELMRLDDPDINDDTDVGNIYRPPPATERACPWCAETIKMAAVVCRYCGRDVAAGPA